MIAAALPWLGCGRVGYDPVEASLATVVRRGAAASLGPAVCQALAASLALALALAPRWRWRWRPRWRWRRAGAGGVSGGGAGGTVACLEALADRAAFDAAASGLATATEDFTVNASGAPVTSFGYYASDAFAHHADITFESFVTSLQAPPGTREARVFSLAGDGVKSSIGFAPGFDGITSRLSAPERAMAYAGRVPLGSEGFTLTVQRSDTGDRTSFTFHPTNQVLFAGVRSRCGGIIQIVDLFPNFSATGDGNSQYWELASVSYAR